MIVQPGLCWTWSETPNTGFLTTRLICLLNKCIHLLFFRCKLTDWDNDTYSIQGNLHQFYINQSIPTKIDGQNVIYSECHAYNHQAGGTYDVIKENRPINSTEEECKEWVYDQSVFRTTFTAQVHSIVAKFNSHMWEKLTLCYCIHFCLVNPAHYHEEYETQNMI